MSIPFIDANVLLRAILLDHADHSPRAVSLLERLAGGEVALRLTTTVFFEVAFVLLRRPDLNRSAVYASLETILEFENFRIDQRQVLRDALRLSQQRNVPLVDAYLVASMVTEGSPTIVSFDRHFDRFDEIQRIEP